jgi:hypothetical protein
MAIPTLAHKMKEGETIKSVVKKYGLPEGKWTSIFEAPYNKKLRKKFKDPGAVPSGEIVKIPKITKKSLDTDVRMVNMLSAALEVEIKKIDKNIDVLSNAREKLEQLSRKKSELDPAERAQLKNEIKKRFDPKGLLGKDGLKNCKASNSYDAFKKNWEPCAKSYAHVARLAADFMRVQSDLLKPDKDVKSSAKDLYAAERKFMEARDGMRELVGSLKAVQSLLTESAREAP